jgi:hypothetical protein
VSGISTDLAKLRAAGWRVAVHNDYMLDGKLMTFWLMTYPGRDLAFKGEGLTDEEALRLIANKARAWGLLDEVPQC